MKGSVALRLGRVSNLPTVWSNVATGAALSGASVDWRSLVALSVALSAFYVGGMFLNDAFDREFDATHRPERPIVRGEVTAREVFAWGFAFLGLGVIGVVATAHLLHPDTTSLALVAASGVGLAALITYYNLHHKSNPLSPVVMGLCRVGVYVCAALALTKEPGTLLGWGAAALLAYLIGLTYVAKQETLSRVKNLWPLAFLIWPFVWLGARHQEPGLASMLLVAFAIWVLFALSFLRRSKGPPQIPRAVVSLIAGIALLDAAVLATFGAPALAMLAVGYFGLTLLLQRYVAGT